MKTIIIAVAPTNAARFQPAYAKFPISDSVLLDCMGSQKATEDVLKAGCRLLGISEETPYIGGLYYKFPERPTRSFEEFLDDLEFRYRQSRRSFMEQNCGHSPSPRRMDILQAIMKL